MKIAIPTKPPNNVFAYTLVATRPAMLTEGATDEEKAVAARHWKYSIELLKSGTIVFGGRTMITTPESFAICVIRAETADAARAIMNADPAVSGGVFRATLYPFQPMLLGEWPADTAHVA